MQNDIALANNRFRSEDAHPLIPLRVLLGNNPVPAEMPQNLEGLRQLSGPNCNICLDYYNLPTDGSVDAKRHRLANHTGARP